MGAFVLTDALVLVNGANLSGQSNKLEASAEVEALDATTFGDAGWKAVAAGLASHAWSLSGFWAAGDAAMPDDRLWADLGVSAAWTATATASEGSVAYLGNVMSGQHKIGGDVGALAPFEAAAAGSGRLVRGALLAGPGTARSTSSNSTGVQLGAVSATQRMYAALHVCSVSGSTPTVVAKLQSASTQGGSYTDRVTFTSANAVSSQLSSVAGAVTDTWWRVAWTIGGSSPSFLFAVAAGVSAL